MRYVFGSAASARRVLDVLDGVPCLKTEGRHALPMNFFRRVGEVAHGIEDVVPVGQVVSHQAFDLVNQVGRSTGLLVPGEDADHRVSDEPLCGYEVSPGLVRVVELVVVGTDVGYAVDEDVQLQLWPLVKCFLVVTQSLDDLVGALGFVGPRHMGGDVGDDGVYVVARWHDGWRREVAGRANQGKMVRYGEAEFCKGFECRLGVERRTSVVAVDDAGAGHCVVGSLGYLAQGVPVLLVGESHGADDACPFGSDGSGRRLVGGGYFSVRHGRVVCAAEFGVEQERL